MPILFSGLVIDGKRNGLTASGRSAHRFDSFNRWMQQLIDATGSECSHFPHFGRRTDVGSLSAVLRTWNLPFEEKLMPTVTSEEVLHKKRDYAAELILATKAINRTPRCASMIN